MEGYPGVEEQDKSPVDARFQVLAAVDFTPASYRELGKRYGEKMLSLLGYQIAEPQ